jgi:hypothetical protein
LSSRSKKFEPIIINIGVDCNLKFTYLFLKLNEWT